VARSNAFARSNAGAWSNADVSGNASERDERHGRHRRREAPFPDPDDSAKHNFVVLPRPGQVHGRTDVTLHVGVVFY
jgi:hypothetical protein